jgi:type IV secretion system protein VirB11
MNTILSSIDETRISESKSRLYKKLYDDLGEEIISYLKNSDVNEIMLNPDGMLWVDKSSIGQINVGVVSQDRASSIINTVAGIHNLVVSYANPRIKGDLPRYREMNGERFTGTISPVVSSPAFNIRKKSEVIYTLTDYVDTDRMTSAQANLLTDLVSARKNILVCGGPGSGKTTVTNALIVEAVKCDTNQRFVILEDLPELQCSAPNKLPMLTTENISMTVLLREAMRRRPDRILIGEVIGAEALDMLKAWNTGCPGGICTVHANGTEEAVQRILDLAMESGLVNPPINLVLQTIDAIVFVIRQKNQKGFVKEITLLEGYENGKFIFKTLV